jgi:hypothetical protein
MNGSMYFDRFRSVRNFWYTKKYLISLYPHCRTKLWWLPTVRDEMFITSLHKPLLLRMTFTIFESSSTAVVSTVTLVPSVCSFFPCNIGIVFVIFSSYPVFPCISYYFSSSPSVYTGPPSFSVEGVKGKRDSWDIRFLQSSFPLATQLRMNPFLRQLPKFSESKKIRTCL